jgi:TRAP transporter TAXI family solute receptor
MFLKQWRLEMYLEIKCKAMGAALVAAVLTFGYAGPASASDSDFAFPSPLRIASSGTGSTGNASISATVPAMESYFGVPVRTLPTSSHLVRFGLVRDGEAAVIAGASIADGMGAIQGVDFFAAGTWGPQPVQAVWYDYSAPMGIMVRGDSDIQSVADLKGKRMVWRAESPGMTIPAEGVLAFAGLTLDDVTQVEVTGMDPSFRAVVEGRADFAVIYTYSTGAYVAEENPNGIRWIPIPLDDQEGWARYATVDPIMSKGVNSKGAPSSIGVPMLIGLAPVMTYADADPELIYRITKFFAEEYEGYRKLHNQAAERSLENLLNFKSVSPIPFHPGTIRYLTEIGEWSEQDAAWNAERVDLFEAYRTAWDSARQEAEVAGVELEHTNAKWLEIWGAAKADLPQWSLRP